MSKIILGICGKARQGKSTVSNHLVDRYNFALIKISDIIREECEKLNNFCERIDKENVILKDLKNKVKLPPFLISIGITSDIQGYIAEPSVLQWWGEVRREFYGSNYFIKKIFSRLENLWNENKTRICIDGIRHENECNLVKLFSFGYLFLIERVDEKGNLIISFDRNQEHITEKELYERKDIKFDFTIKHPEGTTEILLKKIDDLLPDLLIK